MLFLENYDGSVRAVRQSSWELGIRRSWSVADELEYVSLDKKFYLIEHSSETLLPFRQQCLQAAMKQHPHELFIRIASYEHPTSVAGIRTCAPAASLYRHQQ